MKWSAVAFAAALLIGCGGGTGDTGTTVAMRDTPAGVAVSASVAPSDGVTATTGEWVAVQFAFSATTTAGTNLGAGYSGTLVLSGERQSDGSLALRGSLTPASASTAATHTQSYRADLQSLADRLKQSLDHAPSDSKAGAQALAQFSQAFAERAQRHESDLETQAGATTRVRAIRVKGSIAADGSVTLVFSLGGKAKLIATGASAVDGSMTGTFTGPAADDQGTWQAQAAALPPPPEPTPPPPPPPPVVGDPVAGATKYLSYCAGCHTTNVSANVMNVKLANTVAALDASIVKVGAMKYLGTLLTEQDKADIASYIATFK